MSTLLTVLVGETLMGEGLVLVLLPVTYGVWRLTWGWCAESLWFNDAWMASSLRRLLSFEDPRRQVRKVAVGRVLFMVVAFFSLVGIAMGRNVVLTAFVVVFVFIIVNHLSKLRLASLQLAAFPERADDVDPLDEMV